MHALSRLAAVTLCALAAASSVYAQGRVQAVPNVVPSAASRIAQTAPHPAGLMPTFPAGISDGSGAAVATNPIAASTSTIPPGGSSVARTTLIPAELPPSDTNTTVGTVGTVGNVGAIGVTGVPVNNAAYAATVMGAGATVRGPGQATGGAGGISAVDQARSFFFADANHDGELTHAEFARLAIRTMNFEEMDRNFDGVISRFEYDDSLR